MRKLKLKKKYSIILMALSFLCVFILVMGLSYAYFNITAKGKEFVIYTGTLAVDYEKKTDVINLDNLYPMNDEQGLKLNAHEFVVKNNGNIDARYQVRLELDNSLKDMVSPEYIKIAYSIDGGSYSTPVLVSNLDSSLAFIRNKVLTPTNSNTIAVKLWIDLNAPSEIEGKEFRAKIVVDSIQNVDDGYVVDTVPIIYLNKDENGNQDINLKKGETYKELGVNRVVDDQEVFTTSQVTLSYEYYNGTSLSTVSSVDTSKIGIYYITYSITDKSGNAARSVRIVTVNDADTIPSITLNGDATVILGENDYYNEQGVNVADGNKVAVIGEVKTDTIGTYVIRYIVIDKDGNLNSVIRTVIVNDVYQEDILNGADPVLANNLVPVMISDNGTVTKASTTSTWYDYETKQWANAVILKDETINYSNDETIPEDNIESYFVWIPKYSYQLWDLGNYSSLTSIDSTKPHAIPIKFGLTNTSDSVAGECTTPGTAGANGNCKVGDYMTHPAFLAFDSNGMWVGKFETGYDGATSTVDAEQNVVNTSKIVIKPNVYSWRNIKVGNIFKNGYDYNRSLDSHAMKNTEWGAVAYLQHSVYGSASSVRFNNNSAYITGYASTEEPTKGYNGGTSIDGNRNESTSVGVDGTYTINYKNKSSVVASTTGNYTGVYDISGGAWEYVMAYTTGATTTGGSSGITSLYSNFFTDSTYTKYWDKYSSTVNTNYNNRILGDATGEMGPFGSQTDPDNTSRYKSSWYGDYASFAYSTYPWFYRGCFWSSGTNAGAFASSSNTGAVYTSNGFRVVLTPTK